MSDTVTKQCNQPRKLFSIWLSKENREKLQRLGHTGESYNTVVSRLLENIQENR